MINPVLEQQQVKAPNTGCDSQWLLLIQKGVKEKQGLERKTGKASDDT